MEHRRVTRLGMSLVAMMVLLVATILSSTGQGLASSQVSSRQHATNLLASIKKAGVIKVGIAVDPPFCLQDANGKWYSFNPSLVEMAAKQLGVKVDYVSAGWPTIVAGLQASKYDIIGTSISATAERKKAINFTVPYAYGGTSWIVTKSSNLKTLQDLNTPSVTIAFSTNTFQDEITHQMMPKATGRGIPNASYAQLLSELGAGRSQAIAIPSFLVPAILQRFPAYKSIPGGSKGVSPTGVAWGIRKGSEDKSLLKFLNTFIKTERKNGTIKKLMKKYITVENSLKG